MARRTRYRRQKRKPEQRADQRAEMLAELERTLAGTFAAFLMAPAVLLGFWLALGVSDAWFGPTRFETESLLIGGVVGAVAGWFFGNWLYRAVPGFGVLVLWVCAMVWRRSLGRDFRELMKLRETLRAGKSTKRRGSS